jgi:hypothetical protein
MTVLETANAGDFDNAVKYDILKSPVPANNGLVAGIKIGIFIRHGSRSVDDESTCWGNVPLIPIQKTVIIHTRN